MFATALDKSKGKTTIHELPEEDHSSEESSSSSSESSSDSDSDSSDIDEEITPEYLESLLEKARQNASKAAPTSTGEEEVITLQSDDLECVTNTFSTSLKLIHFLEVYQSSTLERYLRRILPLISHEMLALHRSETRKLKKYNKAHPPCLSQHLQYLPKNSPSLGNL